MLQTQTILQHFYKFLIQQILTNSNMGPLLTLHLYLQSLFLNPDRTGKMGTGLKSSFLSIENGAYVAIP